MIKFFRHIRRSLIQENNMGKYFKYAIGEILLVVIGILIALQINNWNNERQDLKKEKYYLSEFRDNLISDTLIINEALSFNKEKRIAIDSCFIELASPNTPSNRMAAIGERLSVLGSFRFFIPNSLGFSNMMSSDNIEIIQSDSLRRLLSTYYNFDYKQSTQKRTVDVTRNFVDYTDPLMSTKERYKRFRNIELDIPSHNDIDIYKDPKFFSLLNLMHTVTEYQDYLLLSKKDEIIILLDKINTSLND